MSCILVEIYQDFGAVVSEMLNLYQTTGQCFFIVTAVMSSDLMLSTEPVNRDAFFRIFLVLENTVP
jgi:hypothetical protein